MWFLSDYRVQSQEVFCGARTDILGSLSNSGIDRRALHLSISRLLYRKEQVKGKTGYQSQQTGEPADPNRPDNAWQPVKEKRDYGAHGAFDKRAAQKLATPG